MPKLDVRDFEKRVRVRRLQMADFDRLVELQERCFPGMTPWLREHIESQIQVFPEGQFGVEYKGKLVASCSSLIVDFDDYEEWHDWRSIAGDGYIRNHDPEGDTLYGIEMMVDPGYQGRKLARRLYEARKELARERNLRRIIIGGRIPGYGRHAHQMSAREYVEQVMAKRLFDPVLTAQLANGFFLQRLIDGYMPNDVESRGYATFLEWTNLDYVPQGQRKFRAVAPVRLCLVQYEVREVASFDEFGTHCEFFCDVASDYKSDFVVFPELLTTQLLPLVEGDRPGNQVRRLAAYTPQYLELFSGLAVKYNVNVVAGSHFLEEDEKLYNVGYLFHRDGRIDTQPKLHITPNEERWWGLRPGDRFDVFETDRGKVAILLDYDVEFPEIARVARSRGADILFVPFNAEERHGYLRVRHCAQARAIENQVYVAIAGLTGNLPFIDNADVHYAQSAIFTPSDFGFARDAIAAETQANSETMLIHDVDTEMLRRHRASGSVRPWSDRRRDLYGVLFRDRNKDAVEI